LDVAERRPTNGRGSRSVISAPVARIRGAAACNSLFKEHYIPNSL